jgi:colanic acid/amylovoran biosynthesis glycosyltransferase
VLAQRETAEIEILVINRGTSREASEVLESFRGSGVAEVRVPGNASEAQCHNLAVEHSHSPLIAHVEPTGIVLPGAFGKIVDRWNAARNTGLIHAYSFPIDQSGSTSRETFRDRRKLLLQTRPPGTDYRRALLFSQDETDAFRVYSRKALEVVGPFRERPGSWTAYDLALRIADRFPIELVPEMLYAFRSREQRRPLSRIASVRNCIHSFNCCRTLRKSKEVSFLQLPDYSSVRQLIPGIWRSLRLGGIRDRLRRTAGRVKSFRSDFFWKRLVPAIDWAYLRFAGRLSWWPVDLFQIRSGALRDGAGKLAYFTWRFPILSQTFVHRELAALKRSGIEILVLAEEPDNTEMADDNARSLLGQTEYLNQIDNDRLRKYKRYFFYRNPFLYTNLLFYLMTRQYKRRKNIMDDVYNFSRAVALAGLLKDSDVDHVHVPWSDETALIAQLASRLVGITYSVQARAHDVHRKSFLYGLRDKLVNAEFIATNSAYNQHYLQELMGKRHSRKVELIYEGLDLDRFVPQSRRSADSSAAFRILCVARIIEQKGLIHLLQACKILLESGVDFTCEIAGGPEEPEYTNYHLELKLLHKKLALGNRVVFSGPLPFAAILEKYTTADLFVLPCVVAQDGSRDITPNALIEAMAMGVCVISTPVAGVPEIVEDGVSGLLVPPGDARALADAMSAVLRAPEARARMGQNARKKVEEKFDLNRNVARYLELFSRVGTSRKPVLRTVSPAPDRVAV